MMQLNVLILTIIASLIITILLGPLFIPMLRRLKFGQQIRLEGPKSHYSKAGTPTMGGVIILLAVLLTAIKFANRTPETFLLLFSTLGFGLIGFLDDYLKVVMRRSLGLTAKQKIVGQLLVTTAIYIFLLENRHSTEIYWPGTDWHIALGWFYLPLLIIMALGTSNAVNLTDGLDGLLAGTAAVAFAAYAIIGLVKTEYEVAIFSAIMVGAMLGFLVFNAHPAKVFMGDTGSLAVGGALLAVAVITKTELLLVLIGGVFVIEALSVMMQVISFQTTGKRIFKMSPLHHHFELVGWSEWKVVATFWFASLVLASIGIYIEVLK
jgi:phospho-N-acetylmuramoyl-pentapeptide-transferase